MARMLEAMILISQTVANAQITIILVTSLTQKQSSDEYH